MTRERAGGVSTPAFVATEGKEAVVRDLEEEAVARDLEGVIERVSTSFTARVNGSNLALETCNAPHGVPTN